MCRTSVLTIALLAATTVAVAEEPGVVWDLTTSMEMQGMKMPGRKMQVCAPVNAEGPEAMSGNDECTVSDVQRSPGRFSYKILCPNGSGDGVMTYQGDDSYTSDVTMTMDGQTMKMSTTGQRGAGTCDASKLKKQVAAMEAQADASVQQMCAGAPEQMMPNVLKTHSCDPKFKKQLCDRLGTTKGFEIVAARQSIGHPDIDSGTLPEAARYCGVDPESLRDRLCNGALQSEDYSFIGSSCPIQAQDIAQRECAGRGYTTPPAVKFRDFCGTYAQGTMDGSLDSAAGEPAKEATPAAPTATDAIKEGTRRLKGLFGR